MMNLVTINAVQNEKDVENNYRQYLTKKFGDLVFSSPFGCDGFGESKKHNVRLLCEFKDDLDLTTKVNQVKVLSQAIYYIKKFELFGKVLPSVIFIGDRNECFAIHTNEIFGYLGMDLDWSIAPSNAHTNIGLVSLMLEDDKIAPHVFSVKDIDQCVDKIKDLTDGVKRLIPITPHNITEVFKYFEEKVLGKHKMTTNQLANLFVQILINPNDNFYHPKKKNILYTKSHGDVALKSTQAFISFFSHFVSEYTPKQREELTAVVDRLVQDVTRRKQGEFFTPTIWVDKAHEYIASVYGDDWKEKYVVWDPAWGTGNLTRDYKFKELYVSTLIYADIETANQMGYNPEATKFQYDFLNDPYEYLPKGLRQAIENGKQIIILMNPPYATAANFDDKKNKEGAILTVINKKMQEDGMGKASANLYTQFLYRIHLLNQINSNIGIGVFCPQLFLSGSAFTNFRKIFFDSFNYKKGFVFKASHFADVSEDWGIGFTILSNGKNIEKFNFDVLEVNEDFNIFCESQKSVYNLDKVLSARDWVKKKNGKIKTISVPPLSSPTVVKNCKGTKIANENFLATMLAGSNNVYCNTQLVSLISSGYSVATLPTLQVTKSNFYNSVVYFSARKLIMRNWINWIDEYMVPNEDSELFEQFKYDSIIHSLFESKSNQSSLRQVNYKDQLWNIKNQFFWMSKEEMTNIANNGNYPELYNDARTDSDRYVYNLLFGEQRIYDQLSDEAKDVLDTASNLVRLSFGMRRNFADDTNHLNSWDAGYAQLKLLWKEYFPEQFKEFRDKYKVLEDKMRPMVYELGFLKK